jgi:hypothetical protein
MKTDHINNILGIVLKGVATICIIVITVIYWQGRDTGKYQSYFREGGMVVFNTNTGEYTTLGRDGEQLVRLTTNPLSKDAKKIIGVKELIEEKKGPISSLTYDKDWTDKLRKETPPRER